MEHNGKVPAFTQPQLNWGLYLLRNAQIIFVTRYDNYIYLFFNLLQQNVSLILWTALLSGSSCMMLDYLIVLESIDQCE